MLQQREEAVNMANTSNVKSHTRHNQPQIILQLHNDFFADQRLEKGVKQLQTTREAFDELMGKLKA